MQTLWTIIEWILSYSIPDKYRGMYEPNANTVEEYLAPLKEMFAKYVPAEEVACIVRNNPR